eukprot:UN21598
MEEKLDRNYKKADWPEITEHMKKLIISGGASLINRIGESDGCVYCFRHIPYLYLACHR